MPVLSLVQPVPAGFLVGSVAAGSLVAPVPAGSLVEVTESVSANLCV